MNKFITLNNGVEMPIEDFGISQVIKFNNLRTSNVRCNRSRLLKASIQKVAYEKSKGAY